jgi:hypothetical protein
MCSTPLLQISGARLPLILTFCKFLQAELLDFVLMWNSRRIEVLVDWSWLVGPGGVEDAFKIQSRFKKDPTKMRPKTPPSTSRTPSRSPPRSVQDPFRIPFKITLHVSESIFEQTRTESQTLNVHTE